MVTRLTAIEELAGVDILCSDKTGTLTHNKLTLGAPFTVNNIAGDQVIVLLAPGVSVIIDTIKESRRIVQRMNSYQERVNSESRDESQQDRDCLEAEREMRKGQGGPSKAIPGRHVLIVAEPWV